MRYLSTTEVLELHRRVTGQSEDTPAVRDFGALQSSVGQPFQTYDGDDLYPSFVTKAAALCYFLIRNHPFVDGNKRIGHAALEVTLALNQLELRADVEEQEALILRVADGSLIRDDFTEWVNAHLVRLTDAATLQTLDSIRDFPHIAARITRARAVEIRRLRVEESYSWRAVAAECHERWMHDAAWEPASNQLAGMELCEAAAEFFGEHFLSEPWN